MLAWHYCCGITAAQVACVNGSSTDAAPLLRCVLRAMRIALARRRSSAPRCSSLLAASVADVPLAEAAFADRLLVGGARRRARRVEKRRRRRRASRGRPVAKHITAWHDRHSTERDRRLVDEMGLLQRRTPSIVRAKEEAHAEAMTRRAAPPSRGLPFDWRDAERDEEKRKADGEGRRRALPLAAVLLRRLRWGAPAENAMETVVAGDLRRRHVKSYVARRRRRRPGPFWRGASRTRRPGRGS